MKLKKTMQKTLWALCLLLFISACKTDKKPDWADINQKVIAEYEVEGRTRTDVPNTGIESNLEDATVTNLKNLEPVTLADGVTAKVYWGMGAFMALVELEPGSSMPER